jgi:hypothetical protein
VKIAQLHLDALPVGSKFGPGSGGRGDPPLSNAMLTAKLSDLIGPRMTITRPINASTEFENWLLFEDYAPGFGVPSRQRLEFRFDQAAHMVNPATSLPLTCYSARLYFRMGAGPILNQGPARIIGFANGHETYSWNYQLSEYEIVTGYPIRSYKPRIRNAYTGTTVATTGNAPMFGSDAQQAQHQAGTAYWRLELQVDSARTPSVVARLYPADSTTPSATRTLSGSPTTVAADRCYLGDDNASGYQQHTYISRFELHDDYDLGGQFTSNPSTPTAASTSATGAPYRRRKYEWFEWSAGELEPLDLVGVWDGTEVLPTIDIDEFDTRDVVNDQWTGFGWFLPDESGPPPTTPDGSPPDDDLGGGSGDTSLAWRGDQLPAESGYRCALYWPTRTPAPDDGWPVVMWAHSGFFITGSYRQLRRAFVKRLTAAGFAVCSVGYRRAELVFTGSAPYPAYPVGQFPSFIVDFKNCANFLRSKGRGAHGDGTYPVNGERLIATGYSAGGYISLAAAFSHNLTDDGFGRDLTINNPNFGTPVAPSLGDPQFLGAVSFGGPTDLQIAVDNDPTVPNHGFDTIGVMEATARAFTGRRVNQTRIAGSLEAASLTNLLALQAAADRDVPRTLYMRGIWDNLVIEEHEEALATAMATHHPLVEYRRCDVDTIHDGLDRHVDYTALIPWLIETLA